MASTRSMPATMGIATPPSASGSRYIAHAEHTSANFLVRSTQAYGHADYALAAGPSTPRVDATGGITLSSGYPYSSSVWMPAPVFDSSSTLSDAPQMSYPNKNPLYGFPAPQQLPPQTQLRFAIPNYATENMAVPIVHSSSAYVPPQTSGSRRSSTDSSASAAEHSPQSDQETEETSSQAAEGTANNKKLHSCWMCHKAFDR